MFECHRCSGECIIRLRYAFFLTVIAFKRVGSTRGPTSGIKAKVTGSNPKGVAGGRLLVDQRLVTSVNSPCIQMS